MRVKAFGSGGQASGEQEAAVARPLLPQLGLQGYGWSVTDSYIWGWGVGADAKNSMPELSAPSEPVPEAIEQGQSSRNSHCFDLSRPENLLVVDLPAPNKRYLAGNLLAAASCCFFSSSALSLAFIASLLCSAPAPSPSPAAAVATP